MKQKFTKSRKANRCSGYHKQGGFAIPSRKRAAKRLHLQPKESPIKGMQLKETGSCTAGRDAFCKDYGVEMDKESYFLELVKDAYGRDAIRQLRESYDTQLVEE